jgi:NTE family protein
MGADTVIAVNLNGHLLDRFFRAREVEGGDEVLSTEQDIERRLLDKFASSLKDWVRPFVSQWLQQSTDTPELFEVFTNSLDIMQDRITRSRLAGDPPDIILAPHIENIGLLEFDQAAEAIEIGRASVKRLLS